ncbi:hypothetical protein KPL78_29750 [Roseomonas sp. HJA6]|uniref:Uncharacterized protein n=1 Tax=Roseomonas alba TaxID=2846776 RepID=A0ABS7AIR0_9PROT|nr:hypothetical protein [Neoroseomonas alba]MBW6402068.1 hypothetical protein [Neoroseomonas alba]
MTPDTPEPQIGRLTDFERGELQRAVAELNRQMSVLYMRHGATIRVVPRVNYSMDDCYAAVQVEVTTGVETFG